MTYRTKVTSVDSLGVAIQQARLAGRMSQRDLAERLGVSQRYVWELESGKDSIVLTRILAALHETGAQMTIEVPEGDDG